MDFIDRREISAEVIQRCKEAGINMGILILELLTYQLREG